MDHHRKDRIFRVIIAALSALGGAFMTYLTRLHYQQSGSTLCDFSTGFSCQIVNQSLFSEFLGIPVAILGGAYFATVIVLLFQKRLKDPYRIIFLFTLFSLVFSLYLSGVEVLLLGSICVFCEASKVLMAGILALSYAGMRHKEERLHPALVAVTLAAAIVLTGATHFLQTA